MKITTPRHAIEAARELVREWEEEGQRKLSGAFELVEQIAAIDPSGIDLVFGDGTDGDTWGNVFGHLARGYTIEVNGVDIQCEDTITTKGQYGLMGLLWDDEVGEGIPGQEREWPWEDIERVVIY